MKNQPQFLLFIVLTLFVTSVSAKTWRINNNDDTADFNEIRAAHDDEQVLSGDTLMVEGSNVYYTSFTCTKQLTIIGPGYFLSTNYPSADVLSAKINSIYINSGSEGSSIIGLTFDYNSGSGLNIQTSSINIERCYVRDITLNNVENIRIINCFIDGTVDDYTSGAQFSNVYLNNCVITGNMSINSNCNFITCRNNIFLGTAYTFNVYHFRNNIVVSDVANLSVNSSYIENNIGTNNVFGGGNLNVDDINALFVGGESPDAKYELAVGSEAIGSGYEGVDCGIFGGDDPYIVSGVPPIPIITELDVDDAVSTETGLRIKIKVRAN